jgi:teichuronic acid biosynthesis glycosyltransferase TuaG
MSQPFFSVIIPCFNRLDLLRETLLSLSRQTTVDFETLLIDDCSPLSMESVFGEYAAACTARGQRAKLIRLERNSGPAHARNVGWNEARGRYVAFLDSDDIWHPQKIAICQGILSRTDAAALFHSYAYGDAAAMRAEVTSAQYSLRPAHVWHGLIRNYSQTSCFILARAINERFDESMRYLEDQDLWLRVARARPLLAVQGPPLTFLGRPLMSGGGLSSQRWKMRVSECRMYWKYCRGSPLLLAFPFLVVWAALKHCRAMLNSHQVGRAVRGP